MSASRVDRRRGIQETAEPIASAGALLAGCTTVPLDDPPVGGLVVCSPICNDFLRNYRREVLLARRLGSQGVAVQRFHYRGTGNSDGQEGAITLDGMQADADAAVDHLRARISDAPIAVLGTRFGALAAASAAARLPGAPLILVDPIVEADRFFREAWRAPMARALKEGRAAPRRQELLAELEQHGSVDILGHAVGRALYESSMGRVLAGELGDPSRPVLVVQLGRRAGVRPETERLVTDLRERGFDVDLLVTGEEQPWWFFEEDEPAPGDPFPEVADWVAARLAEAPMVAVPPAPPAAQNGHAAPTPEATVADETPGWFPVEGQDLFGIITRPVVEPKGVAAVLLSGGAWTPSPGRNRLWVRLARQLAGQGFHGLRLDYHGVGESTGQIGTYLLGEPFVGDVEGLCGWARDQGVDEFVLLGSCFGARTALATAQELEGARGVALFPLPVRDFAMGDKMASLPLSVLARKALRPRTLAGWFRSARRRSYRRLLSKKWRRARARRREEGDLNRFQWVSPLVQRQLEDLVDREIPALLVFGEEDAFYEDFQRGRREGRLGDLLDRAGDLVEVALVPGKTHGLGSTAVQDDVMAVLRQWLAGLERSAPDPVSAGRG
jgi:alpha/beta superfamily hydrolase